MSFKEEERDGAKIIHLEGDIDLEQTEAVRTALTKAIEENKVVIETNKNFSTEITSQCSGGEISYHKYKGYELNDELIGWVSKSYLQYEPTSTLRISTILDKKTTILTKFILSQKLLVEPTISLIKDKIITKNSKLSSYIND